MDFLAQKRYLSALTYWQVICATSKFKFLSNNFLLGIKEAQTCALNSKKGLKNKIIGTEPKNQVYTMGRNKLNRNRKRKRMLKSTARVRSGKPDRTKSCNTQLGIFSNHLVSLHRIKARSGQVKI